VSHHARLLAVAQEYNVPLDVSIELTHHCNFRCSHCYIPDFKAPDRLTTERILTLLDELVEMGTLGLTLTGGELLLRPDWLRIAQRARRLGFALRLFTNGALIDEDAAAAIQGLNVVVEVSLHAMREEVFEKITGQAGSFEKTLSGIERLRQRGVEVVLKTVDGPPARKPGGARRSRRLCRRGRGDPSGLRHHSSQERWGPGSDRAPFASERAREPPSAGGGGGFQSGSRGAALRRGESILRDQLPG